MSAKACLIFTFTFMSSTITISTNILIITTTMHANALYRLARTSAMYSAFLSARTARKPSTSAFSDFSTSAVYNIVAAPTPEATACFQGSA